MTRVRISRLRCRNALAGAPLTRVLDYIEEFLDQDLPLATVAAIGTVSPYHFTRLFRVMTGMSPHQYIIRRRVDRAKLLLTTTDWPLARVAREVGFASGSHLALHFKRVTGISPKRYR
jgi:AraC family transcriptional regulator